jgi:ligand-binding sensor domain-containing protein
VSETSATKVIKVKGKTRNVASHSTTRSVLSARVNDVEIASNRWLAATSSGLYTSSDQGKIWTGGPVMGKQDFVAVRADHEMVVAATRSGVLVSTDGGTEWKQAPLTSLVSSVYGLAIAPESNIFLASREGIFRSGDAGKTWEHVVSGVPAKDIGSITYDSERKRLLATSNVSSVVFESNNNGRSWQRHSDAGYTLRSVSAVRGRLLAATPFDGVVAQPDNDSRSASAEGAGGAK